MRLLKFFGLLLFPLASGAEVQFAQMLNASLSFDQTSIVSSKYLGFSESYSGFRAEYSLIPKKSANWRFSISGRTNFSGDIQKVGLGINYHFQAFMSSTNLIDETSTVTLVPVQSFYAGLDLGLGRVQKELVRADDTGTDVVLGSLYGPSLKLGYMRSISRGLYLSVELYTSYDTSEDFSSSTYGSLLGIFYQFQ